MSTELGDVRYLLDEAADRHVGALPAAPLAAAALARARRRQLDAVRGRVVATATVGLLVAAAVLGLLVAGPVTGRLPAVPASPAGPPALPSRWWTPPAEVPDVTDAPISAASLVLSATVLTSSGWGEGSGYVVVGTDGSSYRRLPVDPIDVGGAIALSSDGRWVAWSDRSPAGSGVGRETVQLLRLADGLRRDLVLPDAGPANPVDRLFWVPGSERLVAVGSADVSPVPGGTAGQYGGTAGAAWILDAARGLVGAEQHPPLPVTATASGPVRVRSLTAEDSAETDDPVASWAVSPDSRFWADLSIRGNQAMLTVSRDHATPVTSRLDLPGVHGLALVGWGATGPVITVPGGAAKPDVGVTGPSRLMVATDTGRTSVLAAAQDAEGEDSAPVKAVAADTLVSGRLVPGARPQIAWYEHRYVSTVLHATATIARDRVAAWLATAGVLVALTLTLSVTRIARRRRQHR